ncbi:hypothetical protein T10_11702 [Trichinella papuae]|uniref:AMP-activated protein kinase glycogen-binding domain-containing protein n=1 Tax=Trichinella papuae TaxID=268474 RepID=A0A0V1MIJ5_9BILA|nr:hypothetical protein T10_11702 [Trichinella papuae]
MSSLTSCNAQTKTAGGSEIFSGQNNELKTKIAVFETDNQRNAQPDIVETNSQNRKQRFTNELCKACVYLTCRCFNWECALLMNKSEVGKWSLKIDIPLGRHEFRFLCNGIWATSNSYAACPYDFGCFNNWLHVK